MVDAELEVVDVEHGGIMDKDEYRVQQVGFSNQDVSEPLLLGTIRPRLRWIVLYWSPPAGPILQYPRRTAQNQPISHFQME